METDYFGKYFNNEGFDFPQLINDDLVQPVRIMFNAKHYVSATKLLLIAIDTVAFIEFGESVKNPFVQWLVTYSDLRRLGVTPDELWEQRNALLHTSGLTSRKVKSGNIRMLVSYVGVIPEGVEIDQTNVGHYPLFGLIEVFRDACGKWVKTYDVERKKIHEFVERYDLIASDARMLKFEY